MLVRIFYSDWADSLLELLDSPNVKGKLRRLHKELADLTQRYYQKTSLATADQQLTASEFPRDARVAFSFQHAERMKLRRFFGGMIVTEMEAPYIVTEEELAKEFCSYLRVVPEHFGQAYEVFLGNLANPQLMPRESDPFVVAALLGSAVPHRGHAEIREACNAEPRPSEADRQTEEDSHGGTICLGKPKESYWSKNGLYLDFVGAARGVVPSADPTQDPDAERTDLINAQVMGSMTKGACERFADEMSRLLPSILKSLAFLVPRIEPPEQPSTAFELMLWMRSFTEWPRQIEPERPIPEVTVEQLEEWWEHVNSFLDCYYAKPAKKDSFDRRIRNALHLLVEADGQANTAVALSLSISAIEALLGRRGDGIARALADNIAALLEPEPAKRPNAVEFVKKLYDIRSRVLHGQRVDGNEKAKRNARWLAAAVLFGVHERRQQMKRAGFDAEKPDELLAELNVTRFGEGQAVYVPLLNVRELWAS